MPLELQAKVLRLLENPTLYRVGGRRPIAIDVRFLAATNKDLQQEIAAGRFREDLYHRLAGYLLRLPPLRERRADVALLAAFFFDQAVARAGLRSPGLSRAALAALLDYSWPGNVRQLATEIAKATLLLEPGEVLGPEHLSFGSAGVQRRGAAAFAGGRRAARREGGLRGGAPAGRRRPGPGARDPRPGAHLVLPQAQGARARGGQRQRGRQRRGPS